MTRWERLTALLAEFGIATECEVPPLHVARPDEIPRYALMEADEGPADNGGPWWNFGDDWKELADAAAQQESPEDWPATLLVDLETGERWECEMHYHVHVIGLREYL